MIVFAPKQSKFSVSGYSGHETQVLDLRNRNRITPRTKEYMDWRYRGEQGPYEPLIYWAHGDRGEQVGMTGVVFRPYWVGNDRRYFAVIGDVSVDQCLRGKGIGRRMLGYVTEDLRKRHSQRANAVGEVACCFVIPNKTLSSCLMSCGWDHPQTFVWYMWIIDPTYKLDKLLRGWTLPALARKISRRISALRMSTVKGHELDIEPTQQVSESFDRVWREMTKREFILRDRSAVFLRWRYERHPDRRYAFWKVARKGKPVGYVISAHDEYGNCWVNDVLAVRTEYIRSMMGVFLRQQWLSGNTRVVRLKLNRNHPYDGELSRCGFIRRSYQDTYQVCWLDRNAKGGGKNWFLSGGDKDT